MSRQIRSLCCEGRDRWGCPGIIGDGINPETVEKPRRLTGSNNTVSERHATGIHHAEKLWPLLPLQPVPTSRQVGNEVLGGEQRLVYVHAVDRRGESEVPKVRHVLVEPPTLLLVRLAVDCTV